MAFNMAKIPSITSIFEREDEKNYTDNALEFQYIISYSIVLNKECPETNRDFNQFSVWGLTSWLIDHYPKFRNEFRDFSGYGIDKNQKIQAKFDGIETKVKKLAYLDLIEEIKQYLDGSKEVTYYKFTESGYMLAWIIESFDESKKENANNQIYKTLQRNANANPSSYDIFGSIEFKKYKEKGKLDELFTNILRNRISKKGQIYTIKDLIKGSPLPHFNDEKIAKLYSEIWHETFNELPDDETRKYCLFWLKLGLEDLMEVKPLKNIRDFEQLRFDLRNSYDILALEGTCSNCHLPSAISINILEYVNRINLQSDNFVTSKCTVCGKNCPISLPTL